MVVKVTKLDNGITVASDSMIEAQTITIEVMIQAGSRHEPPELNGISHFLEHMLFKGTPQRSAQDIAKTFDHIGGHLNAYTSREHTVFHTKILKKDLDIAITVLADILQHSLLQEEEIERERNVILQEIAQSHDTPDDIIFDYYQKSAFPNQALGRPILGTETTVKNLNKKQLQEYLNRYFTTHNCIIVAAGNIEHEVLVNYVTKHFTSLNSHSPIPVEKAIYKGGPHLVSSPLEQVHLILGFNGISYRHPNIYTLQIAATLLGGGMSSRLFQEVREKHGLAYSIYAYASSYADSGTFGIYTGTGKEQVQELFPILHHTLSEASNVVSEEEVARAKAQIKASILMGLESSFLRAEELAKQLHCFGKAIPIEELLERIEHITPEQVSQIIKDIVSTSPPTITALGNLAHLPDYPSH